jgi:hypothetical protein
MKRLNARTTLLKSQYFLEQATIAEADPKILAEPDWLPFAANLEAAIIYARSSIDHLHREFAPMYNSKGYRTWHEKRWEALCRSNPVCDYLSNRRNVIVHQEPEKTHAHVFLEAVGISIVGSMSASAAVTRANGTVERSNSEQPSELPEKQKASSPENNPPQPPKPSSSRPLQTFFFTDPAWRARPAVSYVGEFIDVIRKFISDAETKFQP